MCVQSNISGITLFDLRPESTPIDVRVGEGTTDIHVCGARDLSLSRQLLVNGRYPVVSPVRVTVKNGKVTACESISISRARRPVRAA